MGCMTLHLWTSSTWYAIQEWEVMMCYAGFQVGSSLPHAADGQCEPKERSGTNNRLCWCYQSFVCKQAPLNLDQHCDRSANQPEEIQPTLLEWSLDF